MSNPLVSIVCLCYNHEKFVRQAVESVIGQTYSPLQIIVADDASTDASQSIIQQLKQEHPFLQLLLLAKNTGNCKSFNKAYALVNGAYVIDFSTDDIMDPRRVEKQVKLFETLDDKTGVIFTDATYVNEHGDFIRDHYDHLFSKGLIRYIPQGDVYRNVLSTYFIASPTMMIRRSVLDELNGYDEELSYEDFDFWVRSARNFRYAYLAERLTRIRKLSKSMSTGWYVAGNQQLLSTYKVCVKAKALNRDVGDKAALVCRVRYEIRQAVLTRNRKEAILFYTLLEELAAKRVADRLWFSLGRLPLSFNTVRKFYYKFRYGG